jgi:cyclohexa-1,5-dienecarbonyl-CoA hydratase
VTEASGVRIEKTDEGRRLRLTLDGPRGHALTDRMVGVMREALTSVGDDPHVRLVTLEAEPPDFSFGSSIAEHTPELIGTVLPRFHDLIRAWLDVPAITIALVRGRCLGGGFELALACDFIFAAADAQLGLPEIALGVFPPVGSVLLPARVGSARAMSAIVTGESRWARAWERAGLIECVAEDGDVERMLAGWEAQHLASRSTAALRHAALAARSVVRDAVDRLLPGSERRYLDELMRTNDAREGIHAFLEKRTPEWKHR